MHDPKVKTYFDNVIFDELIESLDKEDLMDFLGLFQDEMTERVEQLQGALSERRQEAIVFHSHKIASGLSTVGIEPLISLAKNIENSSENNQVNFDDVDDLIVEVRICLHFLKELMDERE